MNIFDILKIILSGKKEIDIKKLPSMGLFYKDDFKIYIKKATNEEIINYEKNFVEKVGTVISKIKKIVEKNTLFSKEYTFKDIKSIDIFYLFLEIVKYTNKKPIFIIYYDEKIKKESSVEFGSDNFNYMRIDKKTMCNYDNVSKNFKINDYMYTLPTIGVEDSLTNFLYSKLNEMDYYKYNYYYYDFIYFSDHKNKLSKNEIENLIEIFNLDIDDIEKDKIKNITKIFEPMQIYSLIKNDQVIKLESKIDLSKIWE